MSNPRPRERRQAGTIPGSAAVRSTDGRSARPETGGAGFAGIGHRDRIDVRDTFSAVPDPSELPVGSAPDDSDPVRSRAYPGTEAATTSGPGGTVPAAADRATGQVASAAGAEPDRGPGGPEPGGTSGDTLTDAPAPGLLLRLIRRQEIAFAAVGGANTLLGMVMTVLWLKILPDNWPPATAVALAYCVSILFAFGAHRTLVFRVRGHVLRDFVRFVLVNSGGMLLNMAGVQLAVGVVHLPETPATVAVMGVVAVASFFGHRHFSFRRAPRRAPAAGR
ncbi:GtrA family protein [Nocardia sp. BMG51109]|uniref:GtrA family protein n=1 Tax=Nocardia sp. BMG51109 TaxID=1056816 RepID=UPI000466B470|nr:GtrA family protein [Nocardia sp. BMG51109]